MDVPLRSFILSGANQGRSLNSLPHSLECMISFLGSRRDWRNPAASERSLPIPLMYVCVCVRTPLPPTKALLCLPAQNQGMIIKTKIIVIETKLGDHQRAAFDSIWALREALGLWIWQILLGPNLNGPQRVCLPPFVYMAEIWNKCEHDTPCPLRSQERVCIYMCIHCVFFDCSTRSSASTNTLFTAQLQTLSDPVFTDVFIQDRKLKSTDLDISGMKDMMAFLGMCLFLCIHIYGSTSTYIIILG